MQEVRAHLRIAPITVFDPVRLALALPHQISVEPTGGRTPLLGALSRSMELFTRGLFFLKERITVELVVADVVQHLGHISSDNNSVAWRKDRSLPSTFTRMWMSNVP